MSTLTRHKVLLVTFLLTALAGMLVYGCGSNASGDDNALEKVDFSKETLAHCLKLHGAMFAASTDDLSFFSKAEDEDTAAHFGFTADMPAQLVVDLYGDSEDPRSWLLWTAHSPEEQPSPDEIVNSSPSKGYVAYVVNPLASERKSLEACTG